MKEIPSRFRKNGFDFKLLMREGDIGLLRKTKVGLKYESFEVVIIQRHETFTVEGNQIEASEHLPYPEQWGVKGWTYSDRLSAERKFYELRSRIKGFATPSRLYRTLGRNKMPYSVIGVCKKMPFPEGSRSQF